MSEREDLIDFLRKKAKGAWKVHGDYFYGDRYARNTTANEARQFEAAADTVASLRELVKELREGLYDLLYETSVADRDRARALIAKADKATGDE